MNYAEEALSRAKKQNYNQIGIIIEYFKIIQLAEYKVQDLNKEIKALKNQLEFEQHNRNELVKDALKDFNFTDAEYKTAAKEFLSKCDDY